MTTDPVLAYLRGLLGRSPHERAVARDAVSASAIRTWCDAVGEANPLALDARYARVMGYRDVLAPAAMLQTWTMPGLEPGRPLTAGPAREGDLDEEVRGRLAEDGFLGTLATMTDQEFLLPLEVGDVVVAEDEYIDVSDRKQTKLGAGYFVTSRVTYSRSGAEVVGRITTSVLHFVPGRGSGIGDPGTAPKISAHSPRPAAAGRLTVATSFEPARLDTTPTLIVAGALATRDYYPVHHDRDFARSRGNRDIVMNIMTINGIIAGVVSDWTAHAPLRRLHTNLRAPVYPYEKVTLEGSIRAIASNTAQVDVGATASVGALFGATAFVSLPTQ